MIDVENKVLIIQDNLEQKERILALNPKNAADSGYEENDSEIESLEIRKS